MKQAARKKMIREFSLQKYVVTKRIPERLCKKYAVTTNDTGKVLQKYVVAKKCAEKSRMGKSYAEIMRLFSKGF